jgi:biotin-dependent carboxylase-like uncharacterized protein
MALQVLSPGPLATVQDSGRRGLAHLGVSESGAADQRSLRLANRLVGNAEGAAAIEATMGQFAVRFETGGVIAIAGAPCPARLSGRAVSMYAPVHVRAGEVLELGLPDSGLRTYLAVRGGIDVPPVLGARCTDTLAGLGPPVLDRGSRLPVGTPVGSPPAIDLAPQAAYPDEMRVRLLLGPRDDWFTPQAVAALTTGRYLVTSECDRVGVRLSGPVLTRRVDEELKSEATVRGAVQVPPNGQPIVFLADYPVTGGYPVIGVLVEDDLHLIAQARPGQQLVFRVMSHGGSRHPLAG